MNDGMLERSIMMRAWMKNVGDPTDLVSVVRKIEFRRMAWYALSLSRAMYEFCSFLALSRFRVFLAYICVPVQSCSPTTQGRWGLGCKPRPEMPIGFCSSRDPVEH